MRLEEKSARTERTLRPRVTPSDDSGRQKYVHSVPRARQRIRSQTKDYNPEGSLSDDAEGPLPGSVFLSPVLCLLRTKNIKQVRGTFLQGFEEKQTSMYTVSQDGLGAWEGSLIIKGAPALASQERKCLSLSVIWTFFTSGQYALFLND